MSTAAQFPRGADVEHANFIAIFFAEQHHRAGFLRIVDRHHTRLRSGVGEDFFIHDIFDIAQIFRRDRRMVREIEARFIRIDQRAFLRHVATEHFA